MVMLLNCFPGLCAFPNMVSYVKIARKWGKKREKRVDMMWTVVDMLGYCSHGLCAFPNGLCIFTKMVSNVKISRKSEKKRKKEWT